MFGVLSRALSASELGFFGKLVDSFQQFTDVAESSILDVEGWDGLDGTLMYMYLYCHVYFV